MHHIDGNASFWDREHHVFLGNSLEFQITPGRALIRVGSFDADAPREEIVFRDPAIIYAYLMFVQVLEEQGRPKEEEPEPPIPLKSRTPGFCDLCLGRGGTYDHHENWIVCPDCG